MQNNVLVWFRNNLRIHDNKPLVEASKHGRVLAVYVFDEYWFEPKLFGLNSLGKFRLKFLIESVIDLQKNLEKFGVNLIVKSGNPVTELQPLMVRYNINEIYVCSEPGVYEQKQEVELKNICKRHNIKLNLYSPDLLYEIEKLPFDIENTPDLFTNYRKKVENIKPFEDTINPPSSIVPIEVEKESNNYNYLYDLSQIHTNVPSHAAFTFSGGETNAMQHLQNYIWHTNQIATYKQTRNGMIGTTYSSKFSAWLANGSISARTIYSEIKTFENKVLSNESTYWLVFELMWRDYFKLMMLKYHQRIFTIGGMQQLNIQWQKNKDLFFAWANGQTGYPLIDANMCELKETGYMSNRGRQIVASFLTKNLGINWLWGAFWFEHYLIDYDVSSNYGNWNYAAGIGNDARGFRYFDIYKQATQYDANGDYVRLWIPELNNLKGFKAHLPGMYGTKYINPILDLNEGVLKNKILYQKALKGKTK